MKKILLTLVIFASFGLMAKLNAQCAVSNVSVHLNSTIASGGNCTMNFDISFDLQHNGGNKYIWLHIWNATNYPNLAYSHPPTAAELANSLANVGINNNVAPPVLLTSYVQAPSVPVQSAGLTLSISVGGGAGGSDRFQITGISVVVPGACATMVTLKADLWSTQAASQNSVSCFTKGITFIPNDPAITGFKQCFTPRTITLGIHTTSPTNITVSYKLYKDDGDGVFEPGTDDALVADSVGPYTINSTTPYSKSGVGYTGNSSPGENSSIWVSVSSSLSTNTVNTLFQNQCSPLPIGLKSFTAIRNHSNVNVAWVTSYEDNSKGFEIQRQIGGGNWQTIAFVPTKALNGSSKSDLSYSYVDVNTVKAISNYRIALVDLDGKTKLSDIRSVRGEGQMGKIIVYPNPSFDGKVKVVFDDASGIRDISLMDVNGRTIKQW